MARLLYDTRGLVYQKDEPFVCPQVAGRGEIAVDEAMVLRDSRQREDSFSDTGFFR